jgi:hypothetical protein
VVRRVLVVVAGGAVTCVLTSATIQAQQTWKAEPDVALARQGEVVGAAGTLPSSAASEIGFAEMGEPAYEKKSTTSTK